MKRSKDGSIKKIAIKIPSEIKYIRKVSSKILKDLSSYNIDDGAAFDIRLCVEEAVRNAISHGNKFEKRLSVNIRYWMEGDNLNIEVEDEGMGFDSRHLPDPTDEENIMRNSGRGVYLIKNLMDVVEYNESGKMVRMMKILKHPKKES